MTTADEALDNRILRAENEVAGLVRRQDELSREIARARGYLEALKDVRSVLQQPRPPRPLPAPLPPTGTDP